MRREPFTDAERRVARDVASRFPPWWHDEAENGALLAIWQHRSRFDGRGSYIGWIYVKARHVTIDLYRQEYGKVTTAKHRDMMSHVDIEDHGERCAVDHETPESIVVDHDGDLSYIVATFTPREHAIVAKLVGGMTQQDVAEQMGVTPSHVCHLLRPVKAKITRQLRKSA